MLWKYIEKINWKRNIQHIPFLKNKQLDISITYKGYFWECGLKWNVETCFAARGWRVEFTIFGILFYFLFYDKRLYNENEGRFYLEDEPQWIDDSEPDYLQRVRDFMKKHPKLKEGYYERVVAQMTEDQRDFGEEAVLKRKKELQRWEKLEQIEKKKIKELLTKLPSSFDVNKIYKAVWKERDKFPWWDRIRKHVYISRGYIEICFGLAWIHAAKWDGRHILFDEFCWGNTGNIPDGTGNLSLVLPEYDLYDKEDRLISKASDYKTYEKYKWNFSYDCQEVTHWYLYDKNGNLLYENKSGVFV